MSKSSIKIFGASNCGNVGDDLIALILQKYLRQAFGNEAEVDLIAQQKQYEEVKTADVLIVGGGGLIYDYDINNVRNYCNAINDAHDYRIPVYLMGMGVQHVFSDEGKAIYRDSLPKVSAIATRGTYDSAFIADDLGYDTKRLVTSRDLVFLYDDVIGIPQPVETKPRKKPVLALSLADWRLGDSYKDISPDLASEYKKYREYLDENLLALKKKFDVKVVCQAREDEEVSAHLATLFGTKVITFPTIEDSTQLVEVYRDADYVITNRYHGLIAAIIAHTPALGVSFSTHKSQRLIDDSFSSIKSQFYTVSDFVSSDILTQMADATFLDTLNIPTEYEYDASVEQARKHSEILKYIATDIAKQ
jgi:polysaccharide pyruvyl transferase WcaK-like protein